MDDTGKVVLHASGDSADILSKLDAKDEEAEVAVESRLYRSIIMQDIAEAMMPSIDSPSFPLGPSLFFVRIKLSFVPLFLHTPKSQHRFGEIKT